MCFRNSISLTCSELHPATSYRIQIANCSLAVCIADWKTFKIVKCACECLFCKGNCSLLRAKSTMKGNCSLKDWSRECTIFNPNKRDFVVVSEHMRMGRLSSSIISSILTAGAIILYSQPSSFGRFSKLPETCICSTSCSVT